MKNKNESKGLLSKTMSDDELQKRELEKAEKLRELEIKSGNYQEIPATSLASRISQSVTEFDSLLNDRNNKSSNLPG
jgi:hypothetical protein